MAHDVFISYNSADKAVATAVCSSLENNGVRCWIAPRDLVPGREYGDEIIPAIVASKLLVLIFSSSANKSFFVRKEVERAVSKGKIIVTFRIEDIPPTEAMEYFLSSPHWLDAWTPPLQNHIDQLIVSVKFHIDKLPENDGKKVTVAGSQTRSPGHESSRSYEILPFLLDRKKQRRKLSKEIQSHKNLHKPLVCIMFGEKDNCCRDMFVPIVRHFSGEDDNERFFNQMPDDVPIESGEPKYADELHEAMKIDLEGKFHLSREFSFDELSEKIAGRDAPVIIHSILSTYHYQHCDNDDLIHAFLEFWKECQLPKEQRHPILVCLFIHLEPYKAKLTDRILRKKDPNLRIRNTLDNLKFEQFGLQGVKLQEAEGISLQDVDEWAMEREVMHKYGFTAYQHLKTELKNIYPGNEHDKRTLSDVSDFIFKLLPSPAPRKST